MDMIVFAIILALSSPTDSEFNFPNHPTNLGKDWYQWAYVVSDIRVINLTEHLVKDATYKLRHAEKVQEKHKYSITYELGSIAAGILDRFKFMLEMYRTFSNIDDLANNARRAYDYMHAFHIIQGAYNEIRLERSMFYQIVREFESTKNPATAFSLPKGFTLPKDMNPYGPYMTPSPKPKLR